MLDRFGNEIASPLDVLEYAATAERAQNAAIVANVIGTEANDPIDDDFASIEKKATDALVATGYVNLVPKWSQWINGIRREIKRRRHLGLSCSANQ